MTQAQEHIHATYLGGPTVILEIEGIRFMTDPTLDEKGTTYRLGDLVLEKTLDPFITSGTDVGNIDYVLLSHHQHQDNLDNKGQELLKHVKKVYTTEDGAASLGNNTVGLSPWQSDMITTADHTQIIITATPARHGPAGTEYITGEVIGFLITVKKETAYKKETSYQLYITGDTVFYDGVQAVAQKSSPSYVFAFAGAVLHWESLYMTMNDSDLVNSAFAFPEATIIPVHFEGWRHYSRSGKDVAQTFERLGIGHKLLLLDRGVITELPLN